MTPPHTEHLTIMLWHQFVVQSFNINILCVHCNWSESKAVDSSIALNANINCVGFLQRMLRIEGPEDATSRCSPIYKHVSTCLQPVLS